MTDISTYPIRQLLSGAFSLTHRMAYAIREKDVGKHEELRAQRNAIVEEIERRTQDTVCTSCGNDKATLCLDCVEEEEQ